MYQISNITLTYFVEATGTRLAAHVDADHHLDVVLDLLGCELFQRIRIDVDSESEYMRTANWYCILHTFIQRLANFNTTQLSMQFA